MPEGGRSKTATYPLGLLYRLLLGRMTSNASLLGAPRNQTAKLHVVSYHRRSLLKIIYTY